MLALSRHRPKGDAADCSKWTDDKICSKKTLVGYGALGKGIYCSDAFGKVATYVTCPQCQQNQCQCSPEKREQSSKNKKDESDFCYACNFRQGLCR